MRPAKRQNYQELEFQSTQVMIVYAVMMEHCDKFQPGHMAWVMDNQDIVTTFFDMADEERMFGRKTGQRFICEFLRWKTLKRELKCEFKIDNDNVALLAHSYNLCAGRIGYFRTHPIENLKVPKGYENKYMSEANHD